MVSVVHSQTMDELNPRAAYEVRGAAGQLVSGVLKLIEERAQRREKERGAAWTYKTTGASEGPSPDGQPWSRDYNPLPYPEALPEDLQMYEGTGIGALYGLPGAELYMWQLAGWNLTNNAEIRKTIARAEKHREEQAT